MAALLGTVAISSCSRDEESESQSEFFRPTSPLPVERVDPRQPVLVSEASEWRFAPLVKVEDEASERVLFHGDLVSRPFPVDAVWRLQPGEREGPVGGGYRIEVEIVQVSEWQRPPHEVLAAGESGDYRQVYSRHLFFDADAREMTPERAVAHFPQVGGAALFPVNRSGSWYQHSFKRQVALWFRVRDEDGIPMEGNRIRAIGAIDRRTGYPIRGSDLFGMGHAEYRVTTNTPFWHGGGLDFVLERLHSTDSSQRVVAINEGTIHEVSGFHVQILLFRPGVWESRAPDERESKLAGESSFVRAVEKQSEEGFTLMAVTDGGPTGRDWMMEVIGVDGETVWPVQRNGPFLYQVFGKTARRRDLVEPARIRLTRGPDRDRIVVPVDSIPVRHPENDAPKNLFDQRVPFFYARDLTEAMRALSELVAIEWGPPYPSLPRKPEGFPLALHDRTVHEIAGEIESCLANEGLGLRLDPGRWEWEFPETGEPSPNDGPDE